MLYLKLKAPKFRSTTLDYIRREIVNFKIDNHINGLPTQNTTHICTTHNAGDNINHNRINQ